MCDKGVTLKAEQAILPQFMLLDSSQWKNFLMVYSPVRLKPLSFSMQRVQSRVFWVLVCFVFFFFFSARNDLITSKKMQGGKNALLC